MQFAPQTCFLHAQTTNHPPNDSCINYSNFIFGVYNKYFHVADFLLISTTLAGSFRNQTFNTITFFEADKTNGLREVRHTETKRGNKCSNKLSKTRNIYMIFFSQ